MRILITGSTGMLGSYLFKALKSDYQVFGTGRKKIYEDSENFLEFNLLDNSFKKLISWSSPNVIVHCAAITNLDFAEKNQDLTFQTNTHSLEKLSNEATDCKIIFISSDAVFSGEISSPDETSNVSPINIYGKSKVLGERSINNNSTNNVAIRTTILGKNVDKQKTGFVEWLVNSLANNLRVELFEDAFFTPVTTWDLAKDIKYIIDSDLKGVNGIVHISSSEPISKYKFGLKLCKELKLNTNLIKPCMLREKSLVAKRSLNQSLNSSYYYAKSNFKQKSVDEVVESIAKRFLF